MPTRNRPKIIANFALTVDGKISTRSGTSERKASHDAA
jgi:riboflavin biosynthesis pyrimidine reductase